MKINEIQSDQVKSDAAKVVDLVRSGQDINLAVDTYKNIHSGKLDYDAAFSAARTSSDAEQGRTSQQRQDMEARAKAQKKIDDKIKSQQALAKDKAQRLKNKGTFKKDDDASRKQKAQGSNYTIDPETGQMFAKKGAGGTFYGNKATGSLGLGKGRQTVKKYLDDPSLLLSLGADDFDDALSRGSDIGSKIFKPKGTGGKVIPKYSIRDN
tara:strand:- start:108 stop:737 length:630 start_codon:yes stop_codon:yes gene_type:complete